MGRECVRAFPIEEICLISGLGSGVLNARVVSDSVSGFTLCCRCLCVDHRDRSVDPSTKDVDYGYRLADHGAVCRTSCVVPLFECRTAKFDRFGSTTWQPRKEEALLANGCR